MPGFSAYSTSKYAMEGFSQSLYHEMQLLGIEVVLIEPGGYSTKIFNENRRIAAKSGHKNSPYMKYVTTLVNKLDKRLAKGIGIGNPEDVARLIEKVCTKRRVRLRYIIGSGTRLRLLLEMILPARIYSAILRRLMFG